MTFKLFRDQARRRITLETAGQPDIHLTTEQWAFIRRVILDEHEFMLRARARAIELSNQKGTDQ